MSVQGVVILPIPGSDQQGGSSTTTQTISPETNQAVAETVQNILNGKAASSQNQTHEGSDGAHSLDRHGPSHEQGEPHKQARHGQQSKSYEQDQSHPEPETVKGLISNPSGLYHFINWEDPNLTFASFVSVMSFILATGYLHIMQWVLKALCVALGLLTVVKGVGQAASLKKPNPQRSRPNYYKIPDQTLDRAFSEIREALQFAVVQSQKILIGENVSNTGIAFAVTFLSYWLIKLVPLWWLALTITPVIYLLPLLFRNVSKDDLRNIRDQASTKSADALSAAGSKASDLQRQAQAKSADAFNTSRDKVSDLTGQAQEKSANALNSAKHTTSDIQDQVHDRSIDAANFTRDKASDVQNSVYDRSRDTANFARDKASDLQNNVHDRSKDTVSSVQDKTSDLKSHAQDSSSTAVDHAKNSTFNLQDGAAAQRNPYQSHQNEHHQPHQNQASHLSQPQSQPYVLGQPNKSRPVEQYQ